MWERIEKHKKGPASRPSRSLADWFVPVLSVAALFLLAFLLGYAILNDDRGPENRDVTEIPDVEPGRYILEIPTLPESPATMSEFAESDRTPRYRREISVENQDVELRIEITAGS